MFKRFSVEENVSSNSAVKSSVLRGIRSSLLETYPRIEPVIDDVLPKKGKPVTVAKCSGRVTLISCDGHVLFFQERDGPIFPTIRLLHQYPFIMPKMQVDQGAIKFVLNGSHIFCAGFTSPGGALDEDVEEGAPVCIMAEGKQHALAVGLTKLSTADIKEKNTGVGVDNLHFLGDGLWHTKIID